MDSLEPLELLAGDAFGIYTFQVALEELEYRFPTMFDALKTANPDDVELVVTGDPREVEGYWDACNALENVELPGGYYLYQSGDVWIGTPDGLDQISEFLL